MAHTIHDTLQGQLDAILARLEAFVAIPSVSADPERNLDVFVKSGIGDTSLRFPKNTGVRVRSTVGFGSIKPNGLNWDGEFYTNDLYGQSAATLEITIEGGMGKITLI